MTHQFWHLIRPLIGRVLGSFFVVLLAGTLLACGGGDAPGANAKLTLTSTALSASGTPSDASPWATVNIDVADGPPAGLHYAVTSTSAGIAATGVTATSTKAAVLQVTFKTGAVVGAGSYTDTLALSACLDAACQRHIPGSPFALSARYVVTAPNSVTISSTALAIEAPSSSLMLAIDSTTLTVSGGPQSALTVSIPARSDGGAALISRTAISANQTRIDFNFGLPSQKTPGSYIDSATLKVCYDSACNRQVSGSPFVVTASYRVHDDAPPPAVTGPLVVASRQALGHNVIDAEYSKALDAVVMVATQPHSALYVFDTATRTAKRVLLNKPPTAVSVSPDGLRAAVGHDAMVTHIELASIDAPDAPAPKLLDVSAVVGDLVLDGRGKVHVFPAVDQWVSIRSIDVATNTERQQQTLLYAGAKARLHPDGKSVYALDTRVSPEGFHNIDITSGLAVDVWGSPYHGDYPTCSNLWISEVGQTIYTACGRTFRASTDRSQDLLYSGALALSGPSLFDWLIVSLSQSALVKEIALIEHSFACRFPDNNQGCESHLNLYESAFLNLRARYTIEPVVLAGQSYPQRGLFVFYRRDGSKLMLSRLAGVPDPLSGYQLSFVR